jgi:hypothetical protein
MPTTEELEALFQKLYADGDMSDADRAVWIKANGAEPRPGMGGTGQNAQVYANMQRAKMIEAERDLKRRMGYSEADGGVGGGPPGTPGAGGMPPRPKAVEFDDEGRRALLYQQGALSGQFADRSQLDYQALGVEAAGQRDALRRLASGQQSISAEQLRQGLQQQLAQQRSLAAGAAPRDAAGAARTAAIQSARMSTQAVGQQAIAGMQERQGAQQQLSAQIAQQRALEQASTIGARQTATSAYNNQTGREPSNAEKYGPAVVAGITALSDKRRKTEIRDGDEGAGRMLKKLRAYTWRYKDEDTDGAGERTTPMAQDIERAVGKHAVVETSRGKAIHGAHLASANTAMIAQMHKRLEKIEGRK